MKLLVWTAKPSTAKALANNLSRGVDVKSFLKAVNEFLISIELDGGSANDLVITTAMELSTAGVWNAISPGALAEVIQSGPQKTTELFLSGLPSTYRELVKTNLNQWNERHFMVTLARSALAKLSSQEIAALEHKFQYPAAEKAVRYKLNIVISPPESQEVHLTAEQMKTFLTHKIKGRKRAASENDGQSSNWPYKKPALAALAMSKLN